MYLPNLGYRKRAWIFLSLECTQGQTVLAPHSSLSHHWKVVVVGKTPLKQPYLSLGRHSLTAASQNLCVLQHLCFCVYFSHHHLTVIHDFPVNVTNAEFFSAKIWCQNYREGGLHRIWNDLSCFIESMMEIKKHSGMLVPLFGSSPCFWWELVLPLHSTRNASC